MRLLTRFGRFWWDFVVGEDWIAAVGAVTAIAATAALAGAGVAAWWVMPVGVAATLCCSLLALLRRT